MKPVRSYGVPTASFLAILLTSSSATAQDFGGVLKDILKGKAPSSNSVLGAIKSVADVTSGQVSPSAERPGDAENNVLLYRTSWCGHCKRAAEYMRRNNVAFLERDVETNPSYGAEYKRLGGRGVPFIVIGNKTMNGFSETQFSRDYAEFKQAQGAAKGEPTQPLSVAGAEWTPRSGDTLTGKIVGIQVRAQPNAGAPVLLVLGKTDEVVYMGEERGGFYRVTTSSGEGWVDKLLVRRP